MSEKLIINFVPTGMLPTRKMSPHVPLTPQEIIEDVREACQVGITMAHLHARDPKTGEPTWHHEIYALIISGIRKFAPDLILCVSLSGRNFQEYHQRSDPLKLKGSLKPDMGSLTLSSLNFNKQASLNEPDMIHALAMRMNEVGIVPELEVFDAGMINYANYLAKKKILKPPFYFNLIFGNIACAQADLLHAGVMLNDLPSGSLWSFGGVGDHQFKMNQLAIAMGGGVRVGLEDTLYLDPHRTKLARNIDLLKRIHAIAKAADRQIMSPKELRKLLRLKKGHGQYGR